MEERNDNSKDQENINKTQENNSKAEKKNIFFDMPHWGQLIILLFSILLFLGLFWFVESITFKDEMNTYFHIDTDNQKSTDELFVSMNEFLNTLSSEEIQAIGMNDEQITDIFFKNYTKLNKEIPSDKFELLSRYFLARNTVQDNASLNDANNLKLFLSEYDKTSDYFVLLAQRQDRILKVLASIMTVTVSLIAFLGYKNLSEFRTEIDDRLKLKESELNRTIKSDLKDATKDVTALVDSKTKDFDSRANSINELNKNTESQLETATKLLDKVTVTGNRVDSNFSSINDIKKILISLTELLLCTECEKYKNCPQINLDEILIQLKILDVVNNNEIDQETKKENGNSQDDMVVDPIVYNPITENFDMPHKKRTKNPNPPTKKGDIK